MAGKKPVNEHVKGILCVIFAAFSFSLMSFFVRLSGDLPVMQKVFFRNLIASGIAAFTLARSNEGFKIKKGSFYGLSMRCIFGCLGMICNFWAVDHLGLADSNILNKMSPFFAIILSYFILKEKPDRVEWTSVLIAFTGAVFIVKPTAGLASLPALIGLFSGLGAGIAYTYVRKLGNNGERSTAIVFYFSAFSCLVTLPFFIFRHVQMTGQQVFYLLLSGIAAAGGQFGITAAYTHAPAKEISVFDYSQVLFAAMLGRLFFGESPDLYSAIGYVIIIGTAIFRWKYNLLKSKKRIIFLDIDGTLADYESKVPESAVKAIKEARENGHHVVLCTGRTRVQIFPWLPEELFSGVVSGAGSSVMAGDEEIFKKVMPFEDRKNMVEFFKEQKMPYFLQSEDGLYTDPEAYNDAFKEFKDLGKSEEQIKEAFGPVKKVERPEEVENVENALYYRCHLPVSKVEKRLGNNFNVTDSSYKLTRFCDGEVTCAGIDKSLGMEKYIEWSGLSREQTIAFGDGPNDFEMLSYANTGVAMGNAVPELKKQADMVCGSVDEDGLYEGFKTLNLI